MLEILESDQEKGLLEEQASKRIERFGKNEFTEKEQESLFDKLIEQFDDPMVKLLLGAALISFVISYFSHLSGHDSELPIWIEPFVIFLILIANGLIGLYQDYNAESSIETLKGM